jgi:uncharacterized protein involved in exopolysaccharide biosynthesis
VRLEERDDGWDGDDEPRSGVSLGLPRDELALGGELAGEPDAAPREKRYGWPIDPARVLRVARAGKWWLLLAAAIGVAAGFLVAKLALGRTYESRASLRYEGAPALQASEDGAPADTRADLPTRLESLRRDELLRDVRERMGMRGVGLRGIAALFTVEDDAESGLVTITARAGEAERAATFANTIVSTFLEHERGHRAAEIEAAAGALDERIRVARAELAASRARYDAFRAEHGISDLDTERQAALAQSADLRAQAELAQAEIASLEARVREIRAEVGRTPRTQVLSSQSESVDATELARAEAHLQQLRATLSEDHPRLQVAERQVRSLRSRVGSGGGSRVVGTVSVGASGAYETAQTSLATAQADLEAARQRSVQLARLAEQAAARTGGLSAIEGEAAGFLADLEVKERLLRDLETDRARLTTMLESPDPGFRVVAAAIEPETAVASSRKLVVAGAFPVGLVLLVFLGLLAREVRGLRVHTAAEVAFWGRGPVLGTTTWPRDASAKGDLVADLDDCAPDARGTLLVVGATENEGPLAAEIVRRLSDDWEDATILTGDEIVDGGIAAPAEVEPVAPRGSSGGAIELARSTGDPTFLRMRSTRADRLVATAWGGPMTGQALRRAARLADRVLVIVSSGAVTVHELAATKTRLGRDAGVGYAVVGVADHYEALPDRAGPAKEFWRRA